MASGKVAYSKRENLRLASERRARLLPGSATAKRQFDWLYRHTPVIVFVVIFSFFSLYIAGILGLKAHGSGDIEDIKAAFDFLAYVFPCVAGISAGYGIYKDQHARPFFALSCLFLAAGLCCYLLAHVPGQVFMATVLCFLLAGPYIALLNEVRLSLQKPADAVIWVLRVISFLLAPGVACLASIAMDIGSRSQ